jgi:CRP-like cAMP-binding protein
MEDKSLWYLENIDVTGIFCPKKYGDVDEESHSHKTFKKGSYIYLPDEMANRIFFITEGRVKIGTYGDSGKEVTKALLGKGEVFGELALIGQQRRRDFAYAMDKTSTCILTIKEMKDLMKDRSGLELFFLKIFGSRILDMEKRLESMVFKDSRSRIVQFLFNLTEEKGQRVGYEKVVRNFITHQEIANLTATSRQTVTTVLNELRNKNILTFDRRRLLVRDMKLLAKEI